MMKRYKPLLWTVPFALATVAFLLLPMTRILMDSFKSESGLFSALNYKEIFSNPFYTQSITASIEISLQSMFIGLILSAVAAHSIHALGHRFKKFALVVTNMASNFSGVPLAFAFMIILGNNGVFTILLRELGLNTFNLYSKLGITLVYVYFQVPLGILLLYPAFDRIEGTTIDAAKTLGASKFYFWKKVGIPMLSPALLSTGVILFANSMGAYATAYALTNGAFNLMPIRIGSMISGDIFLKPNLASALSVILASVLLILNALGRKLHNEKK